MAEEVAWNSETYKEKYKDFREMLADSNLSDDEKAELQESYEYDCGEVQEETQSLCQELQNELDAYNEMKEMSRDDIKLLQRATGVPWSQRDGLRGPSTFAQYFSHVQNFPALSNLSLAEIVTEFQKYEDIFNAQNLEERKDLQKSFGLVDDGIYGAQTFWAIYENVSPPQDDTQEQSELPETIVEEVVEPDTPEETEETVEINPVDIAEPEEEMQPEESELSPEELQSKLIEEAKTYPKQLREQLQLALWFNPPDGSFGPISATRALERNPEIYSIEWLFNHYEINTDIDSSLSQSNDLWELQENFLSLYWEYTEILTQNMELPASFVEAIIWKETTYGKNLNSGSGSKWMMQLTWSAFNDMRWDTIEWDRLDHTKVRRYQEIFKSIDLDALLSVNIWYKGPARERIPSHILEAFQVIRESNNISDVQDNIDVLRNHIKWNSREYDHETNIIIGTVYLEFIRQHRANWDLWNTAFRYNWNARRLENGKTEREDYEERVIRRYNQLSQ